MSNFLKEPFELFPVRPERSLSISEGEKVVFQFKGYLTLNEDTTDELEISKHPVQEGASITDHAFKQPSSFKMKILVNDNEAPLNEIYRSLLDLQNSRVPMKAISGKRIFNQMLIKGIYQTTDAVTENVLALNLTLEEIIIVSVTITGIPPRARQASSAVTGATEKAGRKSILKTGFDAGSSFLKGL